MTLPSHRIAIALTHGAGTARPPARGSRLGRVWSLLPVLAVAGCVPESRLSADSGITLEQDSDTDSLPGATQIEAGSLATPVLDAESGFTGPDADARAHAPPIAEDASESGVPVTCLAMGLPAKCASCVDIGCRDAWESAFREGAPCHALAECVSALSDCSAYATCFATRSHESCRPTFSAWNSCVEACVAKCKAGTCGDGSLDPGEECDGTEFRGSDSCEARGFFRWRTHLFKRMPQEHGCLHGV